MNKMRNAWGDLRELSGWDHPDTRTMVRAWALAMVLATAALTQTGCGSGDHLISFNPPGPWDMTVQINVQYPLLEQGVMPRRCTVTLQFDDRQPEFVVEGFEGDPSVSVPRAISRIRPGQHTILVVMTREDGTTIRRQAPSVAVDEQGMFSPSQYLSINL